MKYCFSGTFHLMETRFFFGLEHAKLVDLWPVRHSPNSASQILPCSNFPIDLGTELSTFSLKANILLTYPSPQPYEDHLT